MPIPIDMEPALCEEVVLGFVLSEERAGRVPAWRIESEEIYRLASAHERDRRFRELAFRSFSTLPAAATLHALLAEFEPRLTGVTRAVFQRANRPSQEGAELHVSGSDRVVRTEVGVTRMLAPEALETFLRSEWTHIADMLDPSFGYAPAELEEAGETPFERRLVRDRYRALWTANVTGRLARDGRAVAGAKEKRREEVHRVYAKLPDVARERCFEALWSGERPTHAELLTFATRPSALVERFAPEAAAQTRGERMAGDPCPICRFPAWKWGDALAMPAPARDALASDFPWWKPEEGLCDRCEEIYRSRTGSW